jgi:hypothetical protein
MSGLGNKEGIAETWLRRGGAYAGVSRNIEARQALETGERYAADNGMAAYQVRAQLALSAVAAAAGEMGGSGAAGAGGAGTGAGAEPGIAGGLRDE